MPGFEQHIEKYKHNEQFCAFGISSKKESFNDWNVIARFYASVHLIEALLCKHLDLHSDSHELRDSYMTQNPNIFPRECNAKYTTLKALSRKARYDTVEISDKETLKAQMCLEDLVSFYESEITTHHA